MKKKVNKFIDAKNWAGWVGKRIQKHSNHSKAVNSLAWQ